MRVSVLINSKAGSVNADLVEAKVREALFRCDLRFSRPRSIEEMNEFISRERAQKTDYLVVCGGDGTINLTLQSLMEDVDATSIPPLVLVRSGTANDLAYEMGVSVKIDHAVRNIFEGRIKNIDIVEVKSPEKTAYMLTSGGLGLPAIAADLANKFRSKLQTVSECPKSTKTLQYMAKKGYGMVRKMGPTVYSMMVAEAIRTWKQEGWGLEVQIPGRAQIDTISPIVLVNNQRSIGAHFLPAPYTSNSDGAVNLLMLNSQRPFDSFTSALHIRRGTVEKLPSIQSYELKEFRLKSQNPRRSLTFFGDGEILHRDVQEIAVRCIHRGLPVMVRT